MLTIDPWKAKNGGQLSKPAEPAPVNTNSRFT
jgi:hypothetical protein